MKNTHVISFDWGSVHVSTTLTLAILTDLMIAGQICVFDRYTSGNNKSDIIVNMKLVGCIYPLDK